MSIKLLSRDFAFYGVLDLLRQSLAILLVPIYTRVLSQSRYGDLDMILTVFGALTVLVDLQFIAGFSRFYLERRKTGQGPQFVGTTILTRVLLGAGVAVLFLSLGFSGRLEFDFMPSFVTNSDCWVLVALNIPVTFAFDVLLVQSQMLRRKSWFFAGSFGNTLITTVLCILLTVVVPWGIVGVLVGQLVGKCLLTVVLFVGLRSEISFRYDREIVSELARYTFPLVPGWWVGFSSAYISRFFIYGKFGADENAILAIVTKVAGVLSLVTVAFRTAWQPLAMSYIGSEEGERFYALSLRVLMVVGVLGVFGITVLAGPIIAVLAPPAYRAAELYVPFFLLAILIGEIDVNLQLGNQIAKRTHWMSVASIAALGVNVAVLVTLTDELGIYAAAIGLMASFIAKVAITYFSAQSSFKIGYDRRASVVFASGCVALFGLAWARAAGWLALSYFLVLAMTLGVFFPWLTLSGGERDAIRGWVFAKLDRSGKGRGNEQA